MIKENIIKEYLEKKFESTFSVSLDIDNKAVRIDYYEFDLPYDYDDFYKDVIESVRDLFDKTFAISINYFEEDF